MYLPVTCLLPACGKMSMPTCLLPACYLPVGRKSGGSAAHSQQAHSQQAAVRPRVPPEPSPNFLYGLYCIWE